MRLLVSIAFLATASAIRVPVWPSVNKKDNNYNSQSIEEYDEPRGPAKKEILSNSAEKRLKSVSPQTFYDNRHRYEDKSYFRPKSGKNFKPNYKKKEHSEEVLDHKVNTRPFEPIIKTHGVIPVFKNTPDTSSSIDEEEYNPKRILYKNYRDDQTDESEDLIRNPIGNNEDLRQKILQAHSSLEEDGDESSNKEDIKQESISEHELPKDIPTRPIYPGEGSWSQKGLKHTPYIGTQKYTSLEETSPEGIDIFHNNERDVFAKQKLNFDAAFELFPSLYQENFAANTPELREEIDENENESKHVPSYKTKQYKNLGVNHDDGDENNGGEQYDNEETKEKSVVHEENEEDKEEDFVPTKTYSQIRKEEVEKHLPRDETDPRLREVVIDKTTKTVYSEEGYEDSAYDHAGHERNAENKEGDADFEAGSGKEGKLKYGKLRNDRRKSRKQRIKEAGDIDASKVVDKYFEQPEEEEDENADGDASTASSEFKENKKKYSTTPSRKSNYMSTQEVKHLEMKQNPNGSMEMEVVSEVKMVSSPNNESKPHKYVKIYPKIKKVVKKRLKGDDSNNGTYTIELKKITNDRKVIEEHSPSSIAEENFDVGTVDDIDKTYGRRIPTHSQKILTSEDEISEPTEKHIKVKQKQNINKRQRIQSNKNVSKHDIEEKDLSESKTNKPLLREETINTPKIHSILQQISQEDIAAQSIGSKTNRNDKTKISNEENVSIEVSPLQSISKEFAASSENLEREIEQKFKAIYNPHYDKEEAADKQKNEKLLEETNLNVESTLRRVKRYTLDLPDLSVDTDFIDKINTNLPFKNKESKEEKYPYYQIKDEFVHKNSPLRYAENLRNIPKKEEGKLSFYEQADQKVACQEVQADIDPIPQRVKDKDEGKESDEAEDQEEEQPDLPRLKNLGNKIDCFKLKYFGENPLDSPFFSEDNIEEPRPLFDLPKEHKDAIAKIRKPIAKATQILENKVEEKPTNNKIYRQNHKKEDSSEEPNHQKEDYHRVSKNNKYLAGSSKGTNSDAHLSPAELNNDQTNEMNEDLENYDIPIVSLQQVPDYYEEIQPQPTSSKNIILVPQNSAEKITSSDTEREDSNASLQESSQEIDPDGYGQKLTTKKWNQNASLPRYNSQELGDNGKSQERSNANSLREEDKSNDENLNEMLRNNKNKRKEKDQSNLQEVEIHFLEPEPIEEPPFVKKNAYLTYTPQHEEGDEEQEDYYSQFGQFANKQINSLKQSKFIPKETNLKEDETKGDFFVEYSDEETENQHEKNVGTNDDLENPESNEQSFEENGGKRQNFITNESEEYDNINESLEQKKEDTEENEVKKEEVNSKTEDIRPSMSSVSKENNDEESLEEYDSTKNSEENASLSSKETISLNNQEDEVANPHQIYSTEYPFVINLDNADLTKKYSDKAEKNKPTSIMDLILPISQDHKQNLSEEEFYPKNIYDQIQLLESLPNNPIPTTQETFIDNSKDNQINKRLGKMFQMTPSEMPKVSDVLITPQSDSSVETNVNGNTNSTEFQMGNNPDAPESQALRMIRKRIKPIIRPSRPFSPQVFDISRYIPRTPPVSVHPLVGLSSRVHNTVLPKYKTVSEVHYKDDIQPNEQLNVFADVINNIKNSTRDLESQSSLEVADYTEPISVKINTNTHKVNTRRVKVPTHYNKVKTNIVHNFSPSQEVKRYKYPPAQDDVQPVNYYVQDNEANDVPFVVTTESTPIRSSIRNGGKIKRRKNQKTNEQLYQEFIKAIKANQNNDHHKINNIYKKTQQETEQIFHNVKENLKVNRKRKPIIPEYERPAPTNENIGEAEDYSDTAEESQEVLIKVKRKRRPSIRGHSTSQRHEEYLEKSQELVNPDIINFNEADKIDESTGETANSHVVGLQPPLNVYAPYDEYSQKTRTEVKPSVLNFYPVKGMKPPPNERPMMYSDFQLAPITSNNLYKRANHHRSKRSPSKPTYSEIRRRPSQEATTVATEDDDDDYVPHRPKTYHYDPEKDQIVYDKKPEVEEPEYIEIEVYEEPSTKRSSKKKNKESDVPTTPETPRIDFSVDRRKQFNYLEFVQKLKSNPNYTEIEDPKPTEKPTGTTSTTQNSVTVSGSTTTPEFLSILAKLKASSEYKVIEDQKDKPKKATTKSPLVEEFEDVEEEIEEPQRDIQNSPGAQRFGDNFDRTDDSEYSPKIRNLNPKTNVDLSKYKTISRPTVQPAITTEEGVHENLENVPKMYLLSRPLQEETNDNTPATSSLTEEDRRRNEFLARLQQKDYASPRKEEEEEEDDTDEDERRRQFLARLQASQESKKDVEEATTKRAFQSRRRPQKPQRTTVNNDITTQSTSARIRQRRPTTLRPKTTTLTDTNINEENYQSRAATHPKPTRVYPRRNRVRIRPTTVQEETSTEYVRKIQRRHQSSQYVPQQQSFPSNHKEVYTPIIVLDKLDPTFGVTNIQPARIITPDIIASANNQAKVSFEGAAESRSFKDVEVFKEYDKIQKHGGNYHKEPERNSFRNQNRILPEVSSTFKPFNDEYFESNEEKEEEGNIRINDDTTAEGKETIKENTTTQSTISSTEHEKGRPSEDRPVNDVEVFRSYNPQNRHGGNYRRPPNNRYFRKRTRILPKASETQGDKSDLTHNKQKDSNVPEETILEEEKTESRHFKDVEVLKEYNTNQKHGGNYRKEPTIRRLRQRKRILPRPREDINAEKEETQTEGFGEENEETTTLANTIRPRIRYRPRLRQTESIIEKVVDQTKSTVTPKTEEYILESQLPEKVNHFIDNLEEHRDENQEGTDSSDENNDAKKDLNSSEEEKQEETTKKPKFIRDPSKRLYFYAPI